MNLTQVQLDLQKEFVKLAETYTRLCEEMPKDILAAWYKLVGYLRDCYVMDEKWDGKELVFCSGDAELLRAVLAADGVLASFVDEGNEQRTIRLTTPESADNVIKMIDKTRLPRRKLPTGNIKISPKGSLCNLCLFNGDNIAKQDRRAEMTLGFNKCYGDSYDYSSQECCGEDCLVLDDIAKGTPGLTAEEVTHLMFTWWWSKSRLNQAN